MVPWQPPFVKEKEESVKGIFNSLKTYLIGCSMEMVLVLALQGKFKGRRQNCAS